MAAWGAFAATVPSALWRVLMILGLMPGTTALRQFELAGDAPLAYGYVFALSIVQLTAGFLAVGLVRPWGERLLGRRVPLIPVLVVALVGGLAVVWLFDISMASALLAGQRPDAGLVSGMPLAVMVACYVPVFLWGPLELIATVGYWLRRRQPRPLTSPARLQRRIACALSSLTAVVVQVSGGLEVSEGDPLWDRGAAVRKGATNNRKAPAPAGSPVVIR